MSKLITSVLFCLVFVGCASKPSPKMRYVNKTEIDHCMPVATLTSGAFSLFPPVASLIAKSMIEKKAEEFKANSIEIKEQSGWFQVNIEAIGYQCSEKAIAMKKKKTIKK